MDVVRPPAVALLTGGFDKSYALGLAGALSTRDVRVDFVGSDALNCREIHTIPNLTFLNLRGDQRGGARLFNKIRRVLVYYARLLHYAATAKPPILHLLWNNKFELFDRTLLMAYYRAVGKRIVLTAHNINAGERDGRDSWVNRLSLRIQYGLCDHVFVHTDAMKRQLISGFGVPEHRVTVIPFGINDTIPRSELTLRAARQRLGIEVGERTLLFFGQIAPYKGLEYLIAAMAMLATAGAKARLIIAGRVKEGSGDYWRHIQRSILDFGIGDLVVQKIQFIPDDEVETYFTAADAVVIPYVNIFQSGVPFLAFSFGLPVIATDVGSLREAVTSETGFLCRPRDPGDLARTIAEFYESGLGQDREAMQLRIRRVAAEKHSWETVGERTTAVYTSLTRDQPSRTFFRSGGETQEPSPDRNARDSRNNQSDPVPPHSGY